MGLRALRLRIAAVLCVIGGVAGSIFGYQELDKERRLQREGVTVPAKFVEHDTLASNRGRTSYKVLLHYRPEAADPDAKNTTYDKEFTVSSEIYEAAQNGKPITVRYLPADPTISAVSGNPARASEKISIAVGLMIAGAIMCLIVFRNRPPAAS
ncbi:MAG TPA: DUF3592 domain-containing protein [Isosphaeraceae bacterium]|jgi:hypothetical protein|nr:DUF3592 domain-containing protein [Isosphaeraceae bacterium]